MNGPRSPLFANPEAPCQASDCEPLARPWLRRGINLCMRCGCRLSAPWTEAMGLSRTCDDCEKEARRDADARNFLGRLPTREGPGQTLRVYVSEALCDGTDGAWLERLRKHLLVRDDAEAGRMVREQIIGYIAEVQDRE